MVRGAHMLDELKRKVLKANLMLPEYHLVTFTWGNASGIDPESRLVVIKPSGIPYPEMSESDLVVVDLDGQIVEGKWKPSSDLATHLELYKAFPEIGGIVHTHSRWATIFAQAGKSIDPMGTTHADYFYGSVPCTREMTEEEIQNEYERSTGQVIIETIHAQDPMSIPGVLVNGHGPFTWGKDAAEAAHNAVVLEEVAFMNWHTLMIKNEESSFPKALLDKHYLRKHGKDAYYGQLK